MRREVEFDEDEQVGVLAYEEYLDNQCPGCGGQLDETTDPNVEWHAHEPSRCFRCTTRMQAQEPYTAVNEHTKKPVTPHIQALLWEVRRSN